MNRHASSILVLAAALSLLAPIARADDDDTELCAPLIHLAKKDYREKEEAGLKQYNDAPIYQMRMAATLVVLRFTKEHELLIRATRAGKLDQERLARALNDEVARPAAEDLGALPVSFERWRWNPAKFTLYVTVAHKTFRGNTVVLESCGFGAGCLSLDLLEPGDFRASIDKQARELAGMPTTSEQDYLREHVPASCFADSAPNAPTVDGDQGELKATPSPAHYPMDERLPAGPGSAQIH